MIYAYVFIKPLIRISVDVTHVSDVADGLFVYTMCATATIFLFKVLILAYTIKIREMHFSAIFRKHSAILCCRVTMNNKTFVLLNKTQFTFTLYVRLKSANGL